MCLYVVVACVLSTYSVLPYKTSDGIYSDDENDYTFVLDVERLVMIWRDGALLVGKLDRNGEFNQEQRYTTTILSGPTRILLNGGDFRVTKKVYEFRSG